MGKKKEEEEARNEVSLSRNAEIYLTDGGYID